MTQKNQPFRIMTSLKYEWQLFKDTWVNNNQQNDIICKEDQEDFWNFDNFIRSEVWKTEEWCLQISTVLLFKDKIGAIKVFAGMKTIRICYSPFRIMLHGYNYPKPVTFLLQHVVDKLVECLVRSNPDIKIHNCTKNNEEFIIDI